MSGRRNGLGAPNIEDGAPPSTLAAQIVQNLETAASPKRHGEENVHLQELLNLLLDSDSHEASSQKSPENSRNENRRLVVVLIRACLDPLAANNVFANEEKLVEQACQSLKVVELTIKRSPDLLFSVPTGRDSGPNAPLYLWLLPKLINTATLSRNEAIQNDIARVLQTAARAEEKFSTGETNLNPITSLLESCMKELLKVAHPKGNRQDPLASPARRQIPSVEAVRQVYHGFFNAGRDVSKIVCSNGHQALSATLRIASTLYGERMDDSKPLRKLRDSSLEAGFEILSILWPLILPRKTGNGVKCDSLDWTHGIRALCGFVRSSEPNASSTIWRESTYILSSLLRSIVSDSATGKSKELEYEICYAFADILRSGLRDLYAFELIIEFFESWVEEALSSPSLLAKHPQDLQRILVFAAHVFSGSGPLRESQILTFEKPRLTEKIAKLNELLPLRASATTHDTPRHQKRSKLSKVVQADALEASFAGLKEKILNILSVPLDKFESLSDMRHAFAGISDEDQLRVFETLGLAACARTSSLQDGSFCLFCDTDSEDIGVIQTFQSDSDELYNLLDAFFRIAQDRKTPRLRVSGMMALARILSHSGIQGQFDLSSRIGQWCCSSLKSSSRDIRLAALSILFKILRRSKDSGLLIRNSAIFLEHIRSLVDKRDAVLQEISIMGLGFIASHTPSDEETNVALLRLVEQLGNPNSLICALAFEELSQLSQHDYVLAQKLFEPHWRTLSLAIVKNLPRRPQVAQSVCDLLNMSISDLLVKTSFYTKPYLVLSRQRDILSRIASAHGPEGTVLKTIAQKEHFPSILACLLMHAGSDLEKSVMSLLIHASQEFADNSLAELVESHTANVVCEVLKIAGEQDGHVKVRAIKVLEYIAEVTQPRWDSHHTTRSQRKDILGKFFETWSLAIVQLLSDAIDQSRNIRQPLSERKRCIQALREMECIAKGHLRSAIPQVCTCLRYAIEEGKLSNEAFSAWTSLIYALPESDIEPLVDSTLAVLVQNWDKLDASVQQQAYNMVGHMFDRHSDLIRRIVMTLPSLGSIPLLSKFEKDIQRLKSKLDPKHQLVAFIKRCQSDDATVVASAAKELEGFIADHQDYFHSPSTIDQPDSRIGEATRVLLDNCVRFKDSDSSIAVSCARCLGLIGCIDPNRIEAPREDPQMFLLSNLDDQVETEDFILFFLESVLVKVYLATTYTSRQQMLAYGMQEFLKACGLDGTAENEEQNEKWMDLSEATRSVLKPFRTSRYVINAPNPVQPKQYPIYKPEATYSRWLRDLSTDLLQRGRGQNAGTVFGICKRLTRNQDIAIPNFLMPFVTANVMLEGSKEDRECIRKEFRAILDQPLRDLGPAAQENLIHCSQNVFGLIDYVYLWIQRKRQYMAKHRTHRPAKIEAKLAEAERVLNSIPAETMSQRAIECKNFSRALFYWEQHIREYRDLSKDGDVTHLYEHLQEIYSQIDEPDGIEGISSCLPSLNMEQQLLEHKKAGRWTEVQSWYELKLEKNPTDEDVQFNLLTSLRESGQYDSLLSTIPRLEASDANVALWAPFAIEASWVSCKWSKLSGFLQAGVSLQEAKNFEFQIGKALEALGSGDQPIFNEVTADLIDECAREFTDSSTSTLQRCQDTMLKLHAAIELQLLSRSSNLDDVERAEFLEQMNRRLDALGFLSSEKQMLLGIRRAAMQLSKNFPDSSISSSWLASAKLARQADHLVQARKSVLHAVSLEDNAATMEHCRLMWREGHHRKAIQTLQGAIDNKEFDSEDYMIIDSGPANQRRQNPVAARAHLQLAKWIDKAGQTHSDAIIKRYQRATSLLSRWERGHYHLGRHYNKLLESEKAKPPSKQGQTFINGEIAKLVIENFLRSIPWGTKYIYQTLPKVLTLWLKLGFDAEQPMDPVYGNEETFLKHTQEQRQRVFKNVMAQMRKYIDRLPAFIFYTAFTQIASRICHPNKTICSSLVEIIAKVVFIHPQQAMWPLLAMIRSKTSPERAERGMECKNKVLENAKKQSSETARAEITSLITQGGRLSEQLLGVCNKKIDTVPRTPVSLSSMLSFNHNKAAPCRLVIPIESTLLANMPPVTDFIKLHRPFTREPLTIAAFLDETVVINSLAKPRKIQIRGSDGEIYSLLCKPKDDLRKDQRLLEFNSMISRILKRDAECSKRGLYIKTYAVTPLNEEHGLVEWVDGMRTLRDILISGYRQEGRQIHYESIKAQLKEAIEPGKIHLFTDDLLGSFPPKLFEWFMEMFPEPNDWFAARLRYTRSCAVMSMVGYVLGLGDRHCENILLEEGRGGTFHVDFNCLFDKGKTFETPEMVPFRLTHNMVDAFGAYRENGPFRRSCELTLSILRQYEDTMMTILETFLYDPVTDFIGKKKRATSDMPDTPEGILESVGNRVRGMLPDESVPISVEGHVHLLIEEAMDPNNLTRMYVGWCPFF